MHSSLSHIQLESTALNRTRPPQRMYYLISILYIKVMIIFVHFQGEKRKVEIPEKSRVIDVIRKVKINPETVIVRREDDILLEEDIVKGNDNLEFIRIISGG